MTVAERTRRKNPRRRNQQGFLVVDFLFAITMAAVLIMMMFAFSTTLTMMEITQYIAFSTSRAHMAAHKNQERQVALGTEKFNSFTDPHRFPALAPLLLNGWFEIDKESLEIRGGGTEAVAGSGERTFNEEYGYQTDAMPQTGVRFRMRSKILKMNLPLMGRVTEDDDFGANFTAFLIREPTDKECREHMQADKRFKAILDQDSRFNQIYSGGVPASKRTAYFPMEDTGC